MAVIGVDNSQDIALAVDLDGTLLRSDLLFDSFFDVLARDARGAILAMGALRNGKAALKAAFADSAELDPALLPYEPAVLDLIEAARAEGRKIALVSASDQRLVKAVADHLGVFDEAHGSDGARNLSGETKAALLVERFGEKGFDYVGDGMVDLPVWRKARTTLTARAPARVRAAADSLDSNARHLVPRTASVAAKGLIRAMRPHQWVKNLLVFLPTLAAHKFGADTWVPSAMAFVAFCLIASSVYVLNDLLDLPADRAHDTKRERPFASGSASIIHGVLAAPLLVLAGFGVALAMGQADFLLVLAGYWMLTLAYSMWLKRRLVIDICALAALYTMRVIGGSVATGLVLSPWLFALAIFLFLSLAATKRQAELANGARKGRSNAAGRAYTAEDQPIVAMMAISAGYMSVLVMALFISGQGMRKLYESPLMLWMICPVLLYWISRMVMLAHRGRMNEDPVMFALRDRVSLLCGAAVVSFIFAARFI